MRRRLAQDEGIAMILAMLVLMVVVGLGLGMIALADGQQGPARDERGRMASATLAEAALTQQVFQLSRIPWPAAVVGAAATDCYSNAAIPDTCPDPATVANTFSGGPDYANGCTPLWQTWVRDNGPVTPANSPYRKYYSTAGVYQDATLPAWDQNGDGSLWVGAAGAVKVAGQCRYRRFVTLVTANKAQINFPRNIITANWLTLTAKKKAIVDTTGQHAKPKSIRPPKKNAVSQASPVRLRCQGAGVPNPCVPPATGMPKDQIKPNTAKADATAPTPMFTATQLAGFQQQALAAGTYYTSCPSQSVPLTSKVVNGAVMPIYIDTPSNCSFNAGGNNQNQPGFLVVARGMLTLTGKATFYGYIYNANLGGLTTKAIYVTGSAVVQGGASVDGGGGVMSDSKHTAFIYDPRAFSVQQQRTNAIAVPGTWRELGPTD
jgi:hypothetical protein